MIPNPWKAAFVFLAIGPMTMSGRCFAQQHDGASDGIYAAPDAGQGASDGSPQGERFKRDLAKAEAEAKTAAGKMENPPENNAASQTATLGPAQTALIGFLAGVGLTISLVSVGYVWRVRPRQAAAGSPMILAVNREPASSADDVGTQDREGVSRRAA